MKASAYSGLAFVLPTAMLVGFFVGQWLDGKLGTKFLSIVLLMLGMAGGLYQTVVQARRINNDFGDGSGKKKR